MLDAYSLEQRFVRLDRRLRRARILAIAALALAAALGSCALYFALRTPEALTIGDVTIDGRQIAVRHGDHRSGISADGAWSRDDTRHAQLGPADLMMWSGDGAKIDLWASGRGTMFALRDAPSDTLRTIQTSPNGVAEVVRPPNK